MTPTHSPDCRRDDTRQLLDFAGYTDYLIPLTGALVAKDGPLLPGYEVIPTTYVEHQLKGQHMEPTVPAGSIVRAEVVSLARLEKLDPGVYLLLSRETNKARTVNVSVGRLKGKPSHSRLTLWPDNPDHVKQVILLSRIAFVFRVVAYQLAKPTPLPPPE